MDEDDIGIEEISEEVEEEEKNADEYIETFFENIPGDDFIAPEDVIANLDVDDGDIGDIDDGDDDDSLDGSSDDTKRVPAPTGVQRRFV